MFINPRILRALAQTVGSMPAFPATPREKVRHETIIDVGRTLMAKYGRHRIAFHDAASAMRIGTATLRKHFVDLDALLAEIIRRHLQAIETALAAIPTGDPNHIALRHAAYIAATRTASGELNEAHRLTIRDGLHLPDDERIPIEQMRARIAILIAADATESGAVEALTFLDSPRLKTANIRQTLALFEPARTNRVPNAPFLPRSAMEAPQTTRQLPVRAPPLAA